MPLCNRNRCQTIESRRLESLAGNDNITRNRKIMRTTPKSIALMLLAAAPAFAAAQLHPTQKSEGYVKTLFNKTDSIAVYEALLENAPSEFGSSVPRFAVIGKDRTFYLGIGGSVKTTVSWDFGNVMDNPNEFFTSGIPMQRRRGDGGLVQFSAQQTSLYLNFVGLPGSDNQFSAFIGANLLGRDYAPALQYAYLKYRGFKAGYDKTLFSDPAAVPPTIDYEGPNASTAIGNAQVNYTFKFGKKKDWSAGLGLEMPICSATDAEGIGAYKVNQRVPDIPLFLQWSWGGGSSWLRFSAIMRNMLYNNPLSGKNVDKVGWGIQLSGAAEITPWLTAYYQGVYGKGINSYIQDLTDCGMDLLPSKGNPNVLNAVKSWGAYGGLQFNICPSVFATATYSHVRTYAKDCEAPNADNQYRYAQYAVGNIFWDINSLFEVGLEYIYGRRVNYDGTQPHDSRIQAMVQLSF